VIETPPTSLPPIPDNAASGVIVTCVPLGTESLPIASVNFVPSAALTVIDPPAAPIVAVVAPVVAGVAVPFVPLGATAGVRGRTTVGFLDAPHFGLRRGPVQAST
jgi:hypothetical protein